MPTIEVAIELPFYLRVEDVMTVRYEQVCKEAQLPELVGQDLEITTSRRCAGQINKMSQPQVQYERTTVGIKVGTHSNLSQESVSTFAISNCLEILNHLIASYQATTGEVSNAGFIEPLGTSDMQLFAEIRVNGKDFRDRWPGHSLNTFPLSADQGTEFKLYLASQHDLPLSKLFLTSATLSLERGQYSLAISQAATAVELRMTQYVVDKLTGAGWSAQKIKDYEEKTLGQKLRFDQADLRSLEKHFGSVANFSSLHACLKNWFTPLRNKVIHRGHLASHKEAIEAIKVAREFLKTLV